MASNTTQGKTPGVGEQEKAVDVVAAQGKRNENGERKKVVGVVHANIAVAAFLHHYSLYHSLGSMSPLCSGMGKFQE